MGRNEKGLSKSNKSRKHLLIIKPEREKKMIFVTVGTHEQPFNRLVKAIDELKENGIVT